VSGGGQQPLCASSLPACGWEVSALFCTSVTPTLPQVHLQTQQEVKMRMTGMALQVVRSDGILALYNGLSASLCRQVRCQPWALLPGLLSPQSASFLLR
jgi:hypothetical protein